MTINKNITDVNRTVANRTGTQIKYLVAHYVGAVSTALNNTLYYKSANRQASAHYFVDANSIWQCVEEKDIAWHCGTTKGYKHPECRNANSIGLEICCVRDEQGKLAFDPAALSNATALGHDIAARYGFDQAHILRHYDVTGKICPAPFVEDSDAWADFQRRLLMGAVEYFQQIIQEHCRFSDPAGVWAALDKHPYAQSLYQKWAESYDK